MSTNKAERRIYKYENRNIKLTCREIELILGAVDNLLVDICLGKEYKKLRKELVQLDRKLGVKDYEK